MENKAKLSKIIANFEYREKHIFEMIKKLNDEYHVLHNTIKSLKEFKHNL